jgi:peptidyl-tRNA hydrolase, PTH1 family
MDLATKKLLIIGLGNPGEEYAFTRHNLGFMVVCAFADKNSFSLKKEKSFLAKTARGQIGAVKVHLLLPQTYMNASGQAVRRYMDYYGFTHQEIVVVADDTELNLMRMRLREKGSSGGHNGLKSIEQYLGTNIYLRLKMGIGKVESRAMASHVLGSFTAEEREEIDSFIKRAVNCLERLLVEDVEKIMNDVNKESNNVSN